MAEKKSSVTNVPSPVKHSTSGVTNVTHTAKHPTSSDHLSLFNKENYMWIAIGLAVIALGMFLMSGGKSPNPNVFDQKEVYSPRRITIAPILIIIGLGLEVFAIFRKPKV